MKFHTRVCLLPVYFSIGQILFTNLLYSYYRNYSLYMYVFGVQTIVTVKQQAAGGVELPHINMPLQMGTLVPVTQSDEMETQQ